MGIHGPSPGMIPQCGQQKKWEFCPSIPLRCRDPAVLWIRDGHRSQYSIDQGWAQTLLLFHGSGICMDPAIPWIRDGNGYCNSLDQGLNCSMNLSQSQVSCCFPSCFPGISQFSSLPCFPAGRICNLPFPTFPIPNSIPRSPWNHRDLTKPVLFHGGIFHSHFPVPIPLLGCHIPRISRHLGSQTFQNPGVCLRLFQYFLQEFRLDLSSSSKPHPGVQTAAFQGFTAGLGTVIPENQMEGRD